MLIHWFSFICASNEALKHRRMLCDYVFSEGAGQCPSVSWVHRFVSAKKADRMVFLFLASPDTALGYLASSIYIFPRSCVGEG